MGSRVMPRTLSWENVRKKWALGEVKLINNNKQDIYHKKRRRLGGKYWKCQIDTWKIQIKSRNGAEISKLIVDDQHNSHESHSIW